MLQTCLSSPFQLISNLAPFPQNQKNHLVPPAGVLTSPKPTWRHLISRLCRWARSPWSRCGLSGFGFWCFWFGFCVLKIRLLAVVLVFWVNFILVMFRGWCYVLIWGFAVLVVFVPCSYSCYFHFLLRYVVGWCLVHLLIGLVALCILWWLQMMNTSGVNCKILSERQKLAGLLSCLCPLSFIIGHRCALPPHQASPACSWRLPPPSSSQNEAMNRPSQFMWPPHRAAHVLQRRKPPKPPESPRFFYKNGKTELLELSLHCRHSLSQLLDVMVAAIVV